MWNAIQYLDDVLAPSTHLVGHMFTIADFAVWGSLQGIFLCSLLENYLKIDLLFCTE